MPALIAQRRQSSAQGENMVEDSNPVSDVDDVGRRQKKSLPRWARPHLHR
jgi:hypothetical protein